MHFSRFLDHIDRRPDAQYCICGPYEDLSQFWIRLIALWYEYYFSEAIWEIDTQDSRSTKQHHKSHFHSSWSWTCRTLKSTVVTHHCSWLPVIHTNARAAPAITLSLAKLRIGTEPVASGLLAAEGYYQQVPFMWILFGDAALQRVSYCLWRWRWRRWRRWRRW